MLTDHIAYHGALNCVPANEVSNLEGRLGKIQVSIKHGATKLLRDGILNALSAEAWSGEVLVDPKSDSRITITAVKNDIGLCLQTGNVSRVYADLIKLQTLYLRGDINAAILILFRNETSRVLGSNIASYERFSKEIPIFSRVISLPLIMIGVGD